MIAGAVCALALCANLAGSPALPVESIEGTPFQSLGELAVARYYAYMDLDTASDELKDKILESRNKIIFSHRWVTEGVSGSIKDENGNVIEELPQFYDIFPADWDVPNMGTGTEP